MGGVEMGPGYDWVYLQEEVSKLLLRDVWAATRSEERRVGKECRL